MYIQVHTYCVPSYSDNYPPCVYGWKTRLLSQKAAFEDRPAAMSRTGDVMKFH